ncbi:putative thioredoxin [Mycetocola sp. BIGb0189]|uniref:tetratricopeptide repeat protein n=1 Tax=Mycetocola sp. BIGb0189 TaxID=2940604 RepID=UPI0021673EFF|nr:tetratricopeptide repeat protein [Mycetocola sp. BIGb0189]MCS4275797.1 putative thioredoxin [Mycetocola sp. BIGb0189]
MTVNESIPAGLRGAADLSSLGRPAPAAPSQSAFGVPGEQASASVPAGTEVVQVASLVLTATDATVSVVAELSAKVPVALLIWSPRSPESDAMRVRLGTLVEAFGGRLVLATVDGDANPQLVGAFQAQAVPTVAGLIGGRPVPMFEGDQPDAQIQAVFAQLIELAGQNGVTGIAQASGEAIEPEPEPLTPQQQTAFDAIEAGDFPAAIVAYSEALELNPRDELSRAGLSQVRLLERLSHGTLDEIRRAAAEGPTDVTAQLAVADLDLSGGHIEDAFARLLELFPAASAEDRGRLRERLVEYFDVVGAEDPRVRTARRALSDLLF